MSFDICEMIPLPLNLNPAEITSGQVETGSEGNINSRNYCMEAF